MQIISYPKDIRHRRAAVIGVGHMGQYHAGVYSELFQVELVGVADTNKQRCVEVAERYNTRAFPDYHDLLDQIDLVSIAVPTGLHFQVVRDCLEAGVHVLVEKPLTKQLAEAQELFQLADQRGLTLHIGNVERFNGAVQELKKIVQDPLLIESRRLGPFLSRVQDDGVVLDLMIHDLDIVLNLVNSKARSIQAFGRSVYSRHEDLASIQIIFENGCIANLVASRATQNKIRTMAITQKDAYVYLNYTDQDIHIHRQASSEHILTKEQLRYKQESLIERIFVHKENPLKLEIKHFINCAFNGEKRNISVQDELYSLQIALEIIEMIEKDMALT